MTSDWSVVDWANNVQFPSLAPSSIIFISTSSTAKRNILVLYENNVTSVFVLSATLQEITSKFVIETTKQILAITEVQDEIYMLDECKDLHRLNFNSSYMSQNSNCLWKFVQNFDGALSIAGTTDGLLVLLRCHSDDRIFLDVYVKDGSQEFEVRNSKFVCHSSIQKRNYKVLNVTISSLLKKALFGALSAEIKSCIFVETPSGLLLIVPLLKEMQKVVPVVLNYDKDILVHVSVKKDGSIVLVYSTGKLLFLKYDGNQRLLVPRTMFLPNRVVSLACYEPDDDSEGTLYLLWSDGLMFQHSKILRDSTEIIHLTAKKDLCGVVAILNMFPHRKIIAFSENFSCYEVKEIPEEPERVNKSSDKTLNEICETGVKIENFYEHVSRQEDEVEAIAAAIGCAEMKAWLVDDNLHVQNLSKHDFKRNVWRLQIEVCLPNGIIVKQFKDLKEDFKFESKIIEKTYLLKGPYNLGLKNVSLISTVSNRLIQVSLEKFDAEKSRTLIKNCLSGLIKQITKARNPVFA